MFIHMHMYGTELTLEVYVLFFFNENIFLFGLQIIDFFFIEIDL